jgi:hypothetical protein
MQCSARVGVLGVGVKRSRSRNEERLNVVADLLSVAPRFIIYLVQKVFLVARATVSLPLSKGIFYNIRKAKIKRGKRKATYSNTELLRLEA